jgi:hypothetical protein
MNRAATLFSVAEQADSLESFGRLFRDWLHTLRSLSSRPSVWRAIEEEPPRLVRRFPEGTVADAWLAAYAEYISTRLGGPAPDWVGGRVAPQPWFGTSEDPVARAQALRDSPQAFKSRNLYVPSVDLPLRLRPGRPAKSPRELRLANAARQRRFRQRRRRELRQLRRLAQRVGAG